jgi:NADPH:quinone reductase-like Zn-dependent oxidoreductase
MSKRIFKSALVGAISLFAVAGVMAAEQVRCASIKPAGGRLCVVELEYGEMEWQIRKPGVPVLIIGTSGGMGQYLSEFVLDRHARYVAIVTAEEGHPMLTVYPLDEWIKKRSQPQASYFLNPYPGSLSLEGWDSHTQTNKKSGFDSGLSFTTDGPVLSTDVHDPVKLPVEHSYRVHLPSGRVERIK